MARIILTSRWLGNSCLRKHCRYADVSLRAIKGNNRFGTVFLSRQALVSRMGAELNYQLRRESGMNPIATKLVGFESEAEIISRIVVRLTNFIRLARILEHDRGFIVDCLLAAVKQFDSATHEHQLRVAVTTKQVARKLGFRGRKCDDLYLAALIHDFGKIGLPLGLLNKNGAWTDQEKRFKPIHLLIILVVAEQVDSLKGLANLLRYNHYYDGYPKGIKDNSVPMRAQILSAVDYFDALAFPRPFRVGEALPLDRVFAKLDKRSQSSEVKTPYDPRIIDALREVAG